MDLLSERQSMIQKNQNTKLIIDFVIEKIPTKLQKNRNQLNEQVFKNGESLDSYQIKTYDIKMVNCDKITEVFHLQNIAYDVNKSFKDKQLLFEDFD